MRDMTGFKEERHNAVVAMKQLKHRVYYPKITDELIEKMKEAKTPEELHDLQRKAGFAV